MNNENLNELSTIKSAEKQGIPQVWYNKQWAEELVIFIKQFVDGGKAPEMMEIHSSFTDYYQNIEEFLQIYKHFEQTILNKYPEAHIALENRAGTH
ncbi:MAG: hypothetical protein GWN31_01980 [Candidatus Thorarchaeota archaeon]|nr:hypothetical protein [Candidatus Thorarchaeota archaeon]NIW12709.1 hypothetical protein [Candidatus Thorarchaeota archaeon]NIW50923.1 hypothetical protein [Candidatus Korarchaeota archaeon]